MLLSRLWCKYYLDGIKNKISIIRRNLFSALVQNTFNVSWDEFKLLFQKLFLTDGVVHHYKREDFRRILILYFLPNIYFVKFVKSHGSFCPFSCPTTTYFENTLNRIKFSLQLIYMVNWFILIESFGLRSYIWCHFFVMGELSWQPIVSRTWREGTSSRFVCECRSCLMSNYTTNPFTHLVNFFFFSILPDWGSFDYINSELLWLAPNLLDLLIIGPARTADLNLDIRFFPTSLEFSPS